MMDTLFQKDVALEPKHLEALKNESLFPLAKKYEALMKTKNRVLPTPKSP